MIQSRNNLSEYLQDLSTTPLDDNSSPTLGSSIYRVSSAFIRSSYRPAIHLPSSASPSPSNQSNPPINRSLSTIHSARAAITSHGEHHLKYIHNALQWSLLAFFINLLPQSSSMHILYQLPSREGIYGHYRKSLFSKFLFLRYSLKTS